MRLNDRHNGSIKTLLILALLAANIVLALQRRTEHSQPPGSKHYSRAVFGALAESPSAVQSPHNRPARDLPP